MSEKVKEILKNGTFGPNCTQNEENGWGNMIVELQTVSTGFVEAEENFNQQVQWSRPNPISHFYPWVTGGWNSPLRNGTPLQEQVTSSAAFSLAEVVSSVSCYVACVGLVMWPVKQSWKTTNNIKMCKYAGCHGQISHQNITLAKQLLLARWLPGRVTSDVFSWLLWWGEGL